MNPEEEAYLENLYNSSAQQQYQNTLVKDVKKRQKATNDFDYYRDQYDQDKNLYDQSAQTTYDWDAKEEADRLGAVYTPGGIYNEDNLWEKQGGWEQTKNAGNRIFWNTIFDTIGGAAAIVDLPGYYDPNSGVLTDVVKWAAEKKAETNDQYKIHQKAGAGMLGPGMASWWMENGSSLISSALSFVAQGGGVASTIGKGMQGIKWLKSLRKIDKLDDLTRRGVETATGLTKSGMGRTGTQVGMEMKAADFGRNLVSSTALTQSAAIMSATEVYGSTYDKAKGMGYGEEYAKQVAAQAASTTVNASRANIILNMTSANRFLAGTKNLKGFKPEKFLPSLKDKTLGSGLKEGLQEVAEENVELIAQKQAEGEAALALESGRKSRGIIEGGLPLLTGNVYGDATWKDIREASVLGLAGGMAQTGATDLFHRLGSEKSFGGKTKRFGKAVQEKQKSTEYYPDGTVKHYAGDGVYELEDVMVENEDGEMVQDMIESNITTLDEKGEKVKQPAEARQKVKLDSKGNPVPVMTKSVYSKKEIEANEFKEVDDRLKAFKSNIEKNARVLGTAKYQAQIGRTISDINDVIDNGKETLNKEQKESIVAGWAALEVVNSGGIDLDTEAGKKALDTKKKELSEQFDNMNEQELRKKQDELLEFSLARTAMESFESNTKDHLMAQLNEMKNLTPEQAMEAGYDENYKERADEAMTKVDEYYDRWMEYNSKRSGNVARALFKNRMSYDILTEDIKNLEEKSKKVHDAEIATQAQSEDIDLTEIDEDGVSTKAKYDEAFKIEKEKNKILLYDRRLKALKEDHARLQAEMLELTKSSKANTATTEGAKKHHDEVESKIKEIDKAAKEVKHREAALAVPYDKRIEALGIKPLKSKEQTEIYNKKLKAVEKSKELDRIFDELASQEGEDKLRQIEYNKALEIFKRRWFQFQINNLLEKQEEGGGIHWGLHNVPGRIVYDEVNGEYKFEALHEEEFTSMAIHSYYYKSQLKPGSQEAFKQYKKNFTASQETLMNPINEVIKNVDKQLDELDKDETKYTNALGTIKKEDRATALKQYEDEDSFDKGLDVKAFNKAIEELNKVNTILGLPIDNSIKTPIKLLSKQATRRRDLIKKLNSLKKEREKLTKKKELKQRELTVLTNSLKNIVPPQDMSLYNITTNKKDNSIIVKRNLTYEIDKGDDGIIERMAIGSYYQKIPGGRMVPITHKWELQKGTNIYTRKEKGKGYVLVGKAAKYKGKFVAKIEGKDNAKLANFREASWKISIDTGNQIEPTKTPIQPSVVLSYDNLQKNIKTSTPQDNEVSKARDTYMKAYIAKMIRLKSLNKEKTKLLNGSIEERNAAIEGNKDIIDTFNDLVELRTYLQAQAEALKNGEELTNASTDFADPLVVQMESIIAQFSSDQKEIVDSETKALQDKLYKLGDQVEEQAWKSHKLDVRLEEIKDEIIKHEAIVNKGEGSKRSLGYHKGQITKLNKEYNKARKLRSSINRSINSWENQIVKYEAYAQLLDNVTEDIGFVDTKLNELRLPIQQLYNDIEKWEDVIATQQENLNRVDTNIKENKKLQKQLLGLLNSKQYQRNISNMSELRDAIMDKLEQIGKYKFKNDNDALQEYLDKIADILYVDGKIDADAILDIIENMAESGAISQDMGINLSIMIDELAAFNKLHDQNDKVLTKMDYASDMTLEQINSAIQFTKDSIIKDKADKEVIKAFLGDAEQKMQSVKFKVKELKDTHNGTIRLLSRIDKKLKGNQVDHYNNLTTLSDNADKIMSDHQNTHHNLFTKLNDLAEEITKLETERHELNEYKHALAENSNEFQQESELSTMNDMISYISDSIDNNSNNKLLKDIEAEIAKFTNHYETNVLELAKLDKSIKLQKELIAALKTEDPGMSPETFEKRKKIIEQFTGYEQYSDLVAKMWESDLNDLDTLTEVDIIELEDSRLGVLLDIREAQENDLRRLEDAQKSLENSKEIVTAIFNFDNPELSTTLDEAEKTTDTKEQTAYKKLDEEMGLDGNMIEGDVGKKVEELSSWTRGKITPYSTVPRHITYDKTNNVRKYTADGLPLMTQNPHDLHHMEFMNKYIDNKKDLKNNFKVEYVQLSKPGVTENDPRIVRDENDSMNKLPIVQIDPKTGEKELHNKSYVGDKEALQADIDNPGIYAVVVNNKGERVYMNKDGDLKYGLEGDKAVDYNLVFSTIPNIRKDDSTKSGFSLVMGENMIVNKLQESNYEGYTKLGQFGDTVIFGDKVYHTTNSTDKAAEPVVDLIKAVREQIMQDMQDYRKLIVDHINSGKKAFTEIGNVSEGDMLKRKPDDGKEFRSVEHLFSEDTFDGVVRSETSKGTAIIQVNGSDRTVVSGVPYIKSKDGSLTPTQSGKLTYVDPKSSVKKSSDIETVLRLITHIVPKGKGEFNKTGEFNVVGTTEKISMNLVTHGKDLSNIGLLNKVLNWGGPSKDNPVTPFMIWIKSGKIHFADKQYIKDKADGRVPNAPFFPISSLVEYLAGQKISDTHGNWGVPRLIEMLKEKRKHVHFQLVKEDVAKNEYYHPEIDATTKEIVVRKYDSYNEYMKQILKSNVLNPDELSKIGVKTSVVGKYMSLKPSLQDENGGVITADVLKVNGKTLQLGQKVMRGNIKGELTAIDGDLAFNGELLTSNNISDLKFDVVKPVIVASKKPTTLAKIVNTEIPVLKPGDKIVFANNYREDTAVSGGEVSKKPLQWHTQITAVAAKEGMIVMQEMTIADILYTDFYLVNKKGELTLIEEDQIDSAKKYFPDISTETEIISGSTLHNESRGATFGGTIKSIQDYMTIVFPHMQSQITDDNRESIEKTINTLKMNTEFLTKYLPYLTSGNAKEFGTTLSVGRNSNSKDANVFSLISDSVGGSPNVNLTFTPAENTNIASLIQIPGEAVNPNASITDPTHVKLIMSVLKLSDIGLKIKYTPHLWRNAKLANSKTGDDADTAIELALGALIRSNVTADKLAPIIAHELIHRIDVDGNKDLQGHKARLTDIRNKLVTWLATTGKDNAILNHTSEINGKPISSLAYWMFNSTSTTQGQFTDALQTSGGDVDKLMTTLGLTEKNSMNEFFANTMNSTDWQTFLNSVSVKELGMKTKRGIKNIFQEFIDIVSNILKSLNIDLIKGNVLEEVLEVGAAHFRENKVGILQDIKGDVIYSSKPTTVVTKPIITPSDEVKPGEVAPTIKVEKKAVKIDPNQPLTDQLWDKLESLSWWPEPNEFTDSISDQLSGEISDAEYKEMLSMSSDDLKAKFEEGFDEDDQYSLMGTYVITDKLNISKDDAQAHMNKEEYSQLLAGILAPTEYMKFMDELQNEPLFETHIDVMFNGKEVSQLTPTELKQGQNTFIKNLLDQSESDIDSSLDGYKDTLIMLVDTIENNFKPSKQQQMSKVNKQLTSTYHFNGIDISQVELSSIMGGMTHFLFDLFRNSEDADAFFANKLVTDEIYNSIRTKMHKYVKGMHDLIGSWERKGRPAKGRWQYANRTGGNLVVQDMIRRYLRGTKTKKADIDAQIEAINNLYNNFFLTNTKGNLDKDTAQRFNELVRMHTNQINNLGFKFSEDAIDDAMMDDEIHAVKDKAFFDNSTERNQKDSVPPAIKLLIASLSNQIKNQQKSKNNKEVYENVTSYLGLPSPNEFNDIYNLLVKKLSNTPGDRDKIMSALTEVMQAEGQYTTGSTLRSLVGKDSILRKIMNADGSANTDITLDELNILNQFIQTFSKFSPKFLLARMDREGKIKYIDANRYKTSDKILSGWEESFNDALVDKSVVTEEDKTIDVKALDPVVAKAFIGLVSDAENIYTGAHNAPNENKAKEKAFKRLRTALATVGIEIKKVNSISDINNLIMAKNGQSSIFKLLLDKDSIAQALEKNADDPFYSLFTDRTIDATMKSLAEYTADVTNQVVDNQHMSVDGKTIYAATLNHFLSIATNRINSAVADPNQDLRTEVPHLFNVFTKNSVVRNWLEEGNTTIEVGMFNGLIAQGIRDGIVNKELDSPDKWSMMISSTMQGYYTFFRAADRGTENSFVFRDSKTKAVKKLYTEAGPGTRDNAKKAYYGYLLDEINAMVQYELGVGQDLQFYGKDSRNSEKGSDFRFFSDSKISEDMKRSIKAKVKAGKSLADIKAHLDLHINDFNDGLDKFFYAKAKKVKETIREEGLLGLIPDSFKTKKQWNKVTNKPSEVFKDNASHMVFTGIPSNLLGEYIDKQSTQYFTDKDGNVDIDALNEAALTEMLYDFNMIQTGAYIEQSKLFVGDPAMYKNSDAFFKRMSMMNSTKKISVMDKVVDEVLNETNGVVLKDENGTINFESLNITELQALINNEYVLSKALDKTRRDALQALIGADKNIDDITIQPLLGFNPDYILSGERYDGTFKSMILEEVLTMSYLAKDQVADIEIKNGVITYLDKDGNSLDASKDNIEKDAAGNITNYPQVSKLRKAFSESFLEDGLSKDKIQDKVASYLKPYLKMEEADAQAYTTMAGYKEILLKAGDWKPKHQAAYNKIIQGKELSDKELFLFRVLKTQYTGPMALNESSNQSSGSKVTEVNEDTNLFVPTGYKHSVFPLIPQLIKDTNLSKLNDIMQQKGVTLAQFTTANKFGRKLKEDGKSNTLYNENGEFALNVDEVLTQTTSYQYFGVQLDQSPSMKGKITASTQFRKLILSNMIEAGVPVDYMENQIQLLKEGNAYRGLPIEQIEDAARDNWEEVKANWDNLTPEQQYEASPMYGLYKQYQDIQVELYKRPFDKLIKELELSPITHDGTENGNIVGYHIGNRTSLVNVALEMAKDRNMSDNVKNSIASLEEDSTYIEHVLAKEKVENVLFAIINSRVIKEKRKGEGSPQVASTLFEKIEKSDGTEFKREGKDGMHFSSPDLRHYERGANNITLPAHCMLALPADLIGWADEQFGINGKGGLDGLNKYLAEELHPLLDRIELEGSNEELDELATKVKSLITVIGFRIPNQALNSNEFMRVQRFLPTTAGDTIVVPTEMVAKAGSDYDIDKLNLYLMDYKKPRYLGTFWSAPEAYTFMDDTNSTIRERHDAYLDNIALVKDDEIQSFLDDMSKERAEDLDAYDEQAKAVNTSNFKTIKADFKEHKAGLEKGFKAKSKEDLKPFADASLEAFNTLNTNLILTFKKANSEYTGDFIEKTIQFKGLAVTYLNELKGQVTEDTTEDIRVLIEDPKGEIEAGVAIPLLKTIEKLEFLIETYDDIIKYTMGKDFATWIDEKVSETWSWEQDALPAIKESKGKTFEAINKEKDEVREDYRDAIKGSIRTYKQEKSQALNEDDFSKLPIVEQNGKEGLQNQMVNLHNDIMSLPYNYRQLMAPVDDTITKNQAVDIRGLNSKNGVTNLYGGTEGSTDQMFLSEERRNELTKVLIEGRNEVIESIITKDGKFIDGSDLAVDANGTVTHSGKPVDLQQVNLTDEGNLKFALAMAPIYFTKIKEWGKKDNDERANKALADIVDPSVNIDKFVYFLSGKAGVGQTAVHITHHQLAMAAGLQYNVADPRWIFPHTKLKGKAHFSAKRDSEGEWISETLSAFLNAYVDIAADPYIFDINATNRTANMVFYLLRGGAEVQWVTRFISQPIIKTYLRYQKANESMFNKIFGGEVSKKHVVERAMSDFEQFTQGVPIEYKALISTINAKADTEIDELFRTFKLDDLPNAKAAVDAVDRNADKLIKSRWNVIKRFEENKMFSTERLGEYILFDAAKREGVVMKTLSFLNDNQNIYEGLQIDILDMFLEYQRQSKDFQMMIRTTSPDTKGSQKNNDDNKIFLEEAELVDFKGRFTNLDKIKNESIVSEPTKIIEKAVMMYKELYYFEQNEKIAYAKRKLFNTIEGAGTVSSDQKSKLRSTIDNDLSTAIVMADIRGIDENGKKIINEFNPEVVFNQLFIQHKDNTYVNKDGDPAPLAEIMFELLSSKTKFSKVAKNSSVLALKELKNNAVIQELLGVSSLKAHKSYKEFIKNTELKSLAQFSTLQSRSRKIDVTTANKLRNEFIIIKEFDEKNGTNLYNDLIKLAINQSGIHHNSPITFSNLIPNEDMGVILKRAFEDFDVLSKDDQVKLLNQFEYQFLSRNTQYVPNVKTVGNDTYGYSVLASSPKAKFPFLLQNKFDSKTQTMYKVGIVGIPAIDGKGNEIMRFSNKPYDGSRGGRAVYLKMYPAVGEFVGHGRFFMGYDLSLNQNKSNHYKNFMKNELHRKYGDNAGEIALQMKELDLVITEKDNIVIDEGTITEDKLKALEKDLTVSNNFHGFVSPKKVNDYIMINRPEGLHFNFNTEKYGKISVMERKLRGDQSLFDVRFTNMSKDGYLFGPKGNTKVFKELVTVLNEAIGSDVFITVADKNKSTTGTQVLTLNTSDLSNLKQINGSNIKHAIIDALKLHGKNARSLWAFARNSATGTNKVQKSSPDFVLVNLLKIRDNLPKNIKLKKQLEKVRAERDTHSGTGNAEYFKLDTQSQDLSQMLDWNLIESLINEGYGKFIPKNLPLFTPEKPENIMEHKQQSKMVLSNAKAKEIEAKLKKAKSFNETIMLSTGLSSSIKPVTEQHSLISTKSKMTTNANDIRIAREEKAKKDPCNL